MKRVYCFCIRNWSRLLVLVGATSSRKVQGFVVSNRIGMKFVRGVVLHASVDRVRFLTCRSCIQDGGRDVISRQKSVAACWVQRPPGAYAPASASSWYIVPSLLFLTECPKLRVLVGLAGVVRLGAEFLWDQYSVVGDENEIHLLDYVYYYYYYYYYYLYLIYCQNVCFCRFYRTNWTLRCSAVGHTSCALNCPVYSRVFSVPTCTYTH